MPLAERQAHIVWQGNLQQGNGRISVGSGVLSDSPYSWASRTEQPNGKTSPEELIAAAHAGCFAMAFSLTLGEAGHAPEELAVDATTAFDLVDGAPKVTTSNLHVRARVPGLQKADFDKLLQQAQQLCPVSGALRNNVQMNVTGELT